MFWGLILKPNKKYSQSVSKPFHVSQAALDITGNSDGPVQVIITWDNSTYILCTLRKNKVEQMPLDLNFAEGDEISFTTNGNSNVHLTGYFVANPDDSDGDELEVCSDVSTQSVEEYLSDAEAKKKPNRCGMTSSDRDEDRSIQPKKAKVDKIALKNSKELNGENLREQQKEKFKSLPGGVKFADIVLGDGSEAKVGKKVLVYYEGRLKSNNKIFDSSKLGSGFKFALGRGEVIKGWDVGVVGMRVGGKRKLICPPNAAYGTKGSPPVIPPNSALVFEIELKNVF